LGRPKAPAEAPSIEPLLEAVMVGLTKRPLDD
jgi:hypothetical protein